MNFLLDTNVISEIRKPRNRSHPGVRSWVAAHRPLELFLSVISVLEVEVGIGRLSRRDEEQATKLRTWLETELLDVFDGRILPVNVSVARRAARMHVPDPRPERDALIAATASVHGLTVVTRNTKDFRGVGVPLLNPWDAPA